VLELTVGLLMGSHRNRSPSRKASDIYANLEKITTAKTVAEQAVKDRKVFRLDGGHRYVRQALKARGWVEKFTPKTKRFATGERAAADDDDQGDEPGDKNVAAHLPIDDFDQLVSRALKDHEPDLQFVPHHRVDFNNVRSDILINHFPKANFVTKTGLTACLRDLSWVSDRHSEDIYPRCYILGDAEDNEAFRDAFRRCAVTSFLKNCKEQIVANLDENDPTLKTVDAEWIAFALEMFNKHYNWGSSGRSTCSTIMRQASLDFECAEDKKQWNLFINIFYNVAYKGHVVIGLRIYEQLINDAIKQYEENNPQSYIEGSQNLWIIKPGAMSRGRGIGLYNNLKQIIDLLGPDLSVIANNKWVAQKYIERPLLIHGVKFDIRQWFVVTDWGQLTIWNYKRSYIRFSTTRFTLDRLDTQTHLTNNAIQKDFDLEEDLHEDIPKEKMWFSEDFDNYLKKCGYGKVWEKRIFPAFQQILIETCLAAQDTAEHRKNSFEIYGADFMLDEQLNPWLIEINQGPTMATSTTVSNELVSSLIEDLCKIVIDRRRGSRSPSSETGNFELIYRQNTMHVPQYTGNSLNIEGKGLIKPRAKQRTFVKTIPKSPTDSADSGESGEITKVYSWDVDRINRLAQPRAAAERPKAKESQSNGTNVAKLKSSPVRIPCAPSVTNYQQNAASQSPATQNILRKLKEMSSKSESKKLESTQRKKSERDISKTVHRKLDQPSSAREAKALKVSRPITSKSQYEESYKASEESARQIEITKQIEADLVLAKKKCDSINRPIRSTDKPLEHRLLYPLGLTESRFKIQPRNKSVGKSVSNLSARTLRQMKDLPNLQMLSNSKMMQTRRSPSKVSLSPTVYPFIDGFPSVNNNSQPLPVKMPLNAVLEINRKSHLLLPRNQSQPKHIRQGVPSQRIGKNHTEQYCIKIPL